MSKVVIRDGETLDDALRRFKRQVNKAGTIQECRRRECFLKKNLKRKLKSENARKKYRWFKEIFIRLGLWEYD